MPDLDSRPGYRQDRDPIIESEEFEEALASSRYAGGVGEGAAPPHGPMGPKGPGGRRPTKKAKVLKGSRRPKANGANGPTLKLTNFGNEDGHEIDNCLTIRPATGSVHINFSMRIQP